MHPDHLIYAVRIWAAFVGKRLFCWQLHGSRWRVCNDIFWQILMGKHWADWKDITENWVTTRQPPPSHWHCWNPGGRLEFIHTVTITFHRTQAWLFFSAKLCRTYKSSSVAAAYEWGLVPVGKGKRVYGKACIHIYMVQRSAEVPCVPGLNRSV